MMADTAMFSTMLYALSCSMYQSIVLLFRQYSSTTFMSEGDMFSWLSTNLISLVS